MSGQAHLAMGIFTGTMMVYMTDPTPQNAAIIICLASTASLVPDIDQKKSIASRSIPIISFIVRIFTSHRGILHSPLILAAIYWIMRGNSMGMAIVLGYGSHLLQDLFTSGGLPLMYPISRHHTHLSPFYAGGVMDWITSGFLMTIIFVCCREMR